MKKIKREAEKNKPFLFLTEFKISFFSAKNKEGDKNCFDFLRHRFRKKTSTIP